MGTLNYLKNLFTDKNVASITPSSEFTVKRVCGNIDFSKDITIVEYGPGDGVFTRYLLDNITKNSRIIVFETNEGFIELLKKIDDKRLEVVHESAEMVAEICKALQIEKADFVISGIPFSFIDDAVKRRIVKATHRALSDQGRFLVYQTSKQMLPYLKEEFHTVTDELEIKNIPPMVIMSATKL